MPGIFGVVANDKNSNPSKIAEQMKNLLHHRPFYQSLIKQQKNYIFATLSTNPWFSESSRLASNGDITLLVEGTAFVIDDTIITDDSHDIADKLLKLFLTDGVNFIHRISGHFNVVILDKIEDAIHIFNDRMGFSHLYWYIDDDVFMFGPEIKCFLAWSGFNKKINKGALATFLADESPYGTETLFSSVSMLEPATHLEYRRGKTTIKNYWKPIPDPVPRSSDEIIDEAIILYRRSLEKRIPNSWGGRIILPLSAGMDSRLLLWLSAQFSEQLEIFTHGQKNCTDYKLAKKISASVNMSSQHHLIKLNPDWAGEHAREAVWLNDGQLNIRNATILGIGNEMGESPVPFLNGIIGQHMSLGVGGFAGPEDIKTIADQDELHQCLFKFTGVEKGYSSFNYFLQPDLITEMKSLSKKHVENSFLSVHDVELFGDQKAILTDLNMGRRMQGTVDLNKYMFHDLLPFVDDDLFKFWLSIPLEMRFSRNLYKELYRRKIPELAVLPWGHTGLNLYASSEQEKAAIIKRQKRFELNKHIKRLSFGLINPQLKDEYNHREGWLRNNVKFRGVVSETLSNVNTGGLDIFEQTQIDRLFSKFLNGRDYLFKPIMQVTSTLLWWDQFIANPSTRGEKLTRF